MARIFITGSTDGLGRAAARTLIDEGHMVVLHARSRDRASALDDLTLRAANVVIGNLGSAVEIRSIADQVNAIGRMDAGLRDNCLTAMVLAQHRVAWVIECGLREPKRDRLKQLWSKLGRFEKLATASCGTLVVSGSATYG